MDNVFHYYVKSVYGRDVMYPRGKEQAEALALISGGQKTITPTAKEGLELLGFRLVRVFEPMEAANV